MKRTREKIVHGRTHAVPWARQKLWMIWPNGSRILEWIRSGPCVSQPKVDGLSATLSYVGGRLKYIATRGNGREGLNISHIAAYVKDIPETIPFTQEAVEIRGELHLPKKHRL